MNDLYCLFIEPSVLYFGKRHFGVDMPNYSRQESEAWGKLGNLKSLALSVPPNLSGLSERGTNGTV